MSPSSSSLSGNPRVSAILDNVSLSIEDPSPLAKSENAFCRTDIPDLLGRDGVYWTVGIGMGHTNYLLGVVLGDLRRKWEGERGRDGVRKEERECRETRKKKLETRQAKNQKIQWGPTSRACWRSFT